MTTPRVGVVLVNYHGLDDTLECLKSLHQLTWSDWFPIIVDNASAVDPAPAVHREFTDCQVIQLTANRGWAGGNNAGARAALERGADFVVLLNNDTTVEPNLLDRLVAAAQAHSQFGIIGPVIRDYDPPHRVQTDGCEFNRLGNRDFFQRRPVPIQIQDPPNVADVDIVNGCCLLVRADVFRRVGFIDEAFFLVHEESDFCLRAIRAGYHCGVLAEALVRHKGSQSFRRSGLKVQRYFDARDLFRLICKHGYLPGPRRSRVRTLIEYLKYVYARWEMEHDAGADESARAVLHGLFDALTRRFGAMRRGPRRGVELVDRLFRRRAAARPIRSPEPRRMRLTEPMLEASS